MPAPTGLLSTGDLQDPLAIPRYLFRFYKWVYVHPLAVRFFERDWLVNVILFGNYRRLRDAGLGALGCQIHDRVLQVACVYGNLTKRLLERLAPSASLEVMDVLPIQLANLARKLPADARVNLVLANANRLPRGDASFERVLLFFLLHEQPPDVRCATMAEAWRVLHPGGRLVIVDYHRPVRWHPLRLVLRAVFRWFEPYARDLWNLDILTFLPPGVSPQVVSRRLFFGGLYQMLVLTKETPGPSR